MRYLTLFIIMTYTLIASSDIKAQVIVSLKPSKDTVIMGDTFQLSITINIPSSATPKSLDFSPWKKIENKIYIQDTTLLEKYADLDVLSSGKWPYSEPNSTTDLTKIEFVANWDMAQAENTFTVAIYNPGIFQITSPKCDTEQSLEQLPVESKQIVVLPPAGFAVSDSIQLQPIKDIMTEGITFSDYLPYLYGLGILLILGLIAFYLYRKFSKKKTIEPEIIPEIILPAHEKALLALQELKGEELWQKGEIKLFQTKLTFIIREYLENRYNFKALEMTTDEILAVLKKNNFNPLFAQNLNQILTIADLVKFAKATPDESIHENFLQQAFEFVYNTQKTDE